MDSNEKNNEKVLELNVLDLIAIATRDLRKINVPVELSKQIAIPIYEAVNVLDFALQQIQSANAKQEEASEKEPIPKIEENLEKEENQNGTN